MTDPRRQRQIFFALTITGLGTMENLNASNMSYIDRAYSIDTGGGIFVDVLVLEDGTTVSITDESVIVWEKEEHFIEYEIDQDGPLRNYTAVSVVSTPHLVHESRR